MDQEQRRALQGRVERHGQGRRLSATARLASLIDIRDKVIRKNINDINSFAVNLADLTNEVHRDGFSRRNETNIDFFKHLMISDNVDGNVDLNNDGVNDVTAIFKVSGNNKIDASAAIGISGTLTFVANNELESNVQIDYNASDTALTIIKKINDAHDGRCRLHEP